VYKLSCLNVAGYYKLCCYAVTILTLRASSQFVVNVVAMKDTA